MPAFKFTKVNPGDVLTIDYDLSTIGVFAKINNAILSAGITGTWSSDYKKSYHLKYNSCHFQFYHLH